MSSFCTYFFLTFLDEPSEQPQTGGEDGDASDGGLDSYSSVTPSFSETSVLLTKASSEPSDSAFTSVWLHLINYFQEKINDLLQLDGLHAIPFLQVCSSYLNDFLTLATRILLILN